MTNEPLPELASLAERITGPVKGYYLASYAVLSQVGYEGYAKICDAAPRDVWDCHAILKVWSGSTWSVETALQIAEQVAVATIGSLAQNTPVHSLT
jgi:hypothetical protein